jgi:hypothetical protein
MLRLITRMFLFSALLSPVSLAAQDRLRAVSYGVPPSAEINTRVFSSAGAQLHEISGVRVVDPDGHIFLPYLGSVGPSVLSLPIQSGDRTPLPIAERSRVREQVQFSGGIVSLALSTVALIIKG